MKVFIVSGILCLKRSESATLKMHNDECLIAQEYKYANV